MNLPTNTKPWIQGAVVGAVAAAIIGFTWGGWVTGGSADRRVAVASHDGAVAALASICADRFRSQGDAAVKLVELSKVSSWERGRFIEGHIRGDRKAVFRSYFYIFGISAVQAFTQSSHPNAHKITIREAELTLAAAGEGIKTYLIAGLDGFDVGPDRDDGTGAVGP